MVVAVAILGILIMIMMVLQSELLTFDRKTRVDLFTQPDTSMVIHRFRHDVLDAAGYHNGTYEGYKQGDTTLLLDIRDPDTTVRSHVVVWDFSDSTTAHRYEFVNREQQSHWFTHAGVMYLISAYRRCEEKRDPEDPRPADCYSPFFVHLTGTDKKGAQVVDEILVPYALR
jgi:hypothetical protein